LGIITPFQHFYFGIRIRSLFSIYTSCLGIQIFGIFACCWCDPLLVMAID